MAPGAPASSSHRSGPDALPSGRSLIEGLVFAQRGSDLLTFELRMFRFRVRLLGSPIIPMIAFHSLTTGRILGALR